MAEEEPKKERVIIRRLDENALDKRPFEHSIHFEFNSEIDGKDYIGQFVYKKLTLGDYGKISAIKIRLNGGNPDDMVDAATLDLNNAIAHCVVWFRGMDNSPAWAKDLSLLYDSEIVFSLYKEGISFEKSFRKTVG